MRSSPGSRVFGAGQYEPVKESQPNRQRCQLPWSRGSQRGVELDWSPVDEVDSVGQSQTQTVTGSQPFLRGRGYGLKRSAVVENSTTAAGRDYLWIVSFQGPGGCRLRLSGGREQAKLSPLLAHRVIIA